MRRASWQSRSAKWPATHERTARLGGALFSLRVRPACRRADPVARRAPARPRRGRRSSRARAGPGNLVSARRAEDPAGWLYRTARNLAIDALRRERTHAQALPRLAEDAERESSPLEAHFADEIGCASWTWIMTRRRPPSLALGSTRSSGSFISFSVRAATSPMATCRSAAVPGDSSEPSPAAPAGAAGPLRLPRPRILPQRPRSAHGRSASPRRKAR